MFTTVAMNDAFALREALGSDGCVLVTGVETRADLVHVAETLGTIMVHRDADATGVTDLAVSAERGSSPGFGGFSSAPLELHTDRSTLSTPPNLLILRCELQSDLGGELRCVDGRALYFRLRDLAPDVFAWATREDQFVYFDGNAPYTGPIFQLTDTGTIALRFRCDGRGYYRRGDVALLERFLAHAAEIETMVKLKRSEAIVLNNSRWLHGRTRFAGSREMWRILLDNPSFGRGFTTEQVDQRVAGALS